MMIISQTPLRVSFCGGGSDLAAYYQNSKNGGCVTSLSLAKYIHVTVNKRFEDDIRVSYSKTEIVDDFEDLQHELVREAMRMTGVTKGVEITTIADIPSKGTGLGSSSAVTVGLLSALYAYSGQDVSAVRIAEQACEIEISILGQTIGKQDQYGCAIGGINHISFNRDDTVGIEPLAMPDSLISKMEEEFTLLYTGKTRSATKVLSRQSQNTAAKMESLDRMVEQAKEVKELLLAGEFKKVGELLHETWEIKKKLAQGISIPEIDELYDIIRSSGATGGKLLGAGGGGFILFHGSKEVRAKVAESLPNYRLLPVEVATEAVSIIFSN